MDLKEIKKQIQSILHTKYGTASLSTLKTLNDDEIQAKGFVLAKHASGIRKYCKRHDLKVSFRNAGENTLSRIAAGHPCKGHDIMSKSIKEKKVDGVMKWTYDGDHAILEKYKGTVGYSEASKTELAGLWVFKTPGNDVKMCENEQIKLANVNDINFKKAYTGDYDMHDLIKGNKRILATSPDEASTLEGLNNAILVDDETRKNDVLDNKMRREVKQEIQQMA